MSEHWIRKRQILGLLGGAQGGGFVSGEALAESLGISRAAISKHIDALEAYGVGVYSVKGKGYKLETPVLLIDESRLVSAIANRCFYFDEIGSTNAFMLSHVTELKSGDICVAEYQSAGRGRRGRTWVSPYGNHLYCSLFWRFNQGMAQAMGLSLVVACSLVEVLKRFDVAQVGVKWPNDIYLDHKKLAGILVEMSGQADSECHIVIGIGINMSMSVSQAQLIDQPWSDLSALSRPPAKTELMIALQQQLSADLRLFERQGLAAFTGRWQSVDLFMNRPVRLLMGETQIEGICRGIDEQGALLLENDAGLTAYVGGEISLRPGVE
jgi:BirA family transcriptional regulator, biotin operon repressor / biotin---[acetyl-CoA-carboxylase] ligase